MQHTESDEAKLVKMMRRVTAYHGAHIFCLHWAVHHMSLCALQGFNLRQTIPQLGHLLVKVQLLPCLNPKNRKCR